VGTLLGEDRESYTSRRSDVREVWFHDLTDGATVAFEAGKKPFGDPRLPVFKRPHMHLEVHRPGLEAAPNHAVAASPSAPALG
jgi:hypothetical protein